MSKSDQSAEANVLTLVRCGGRCFVLKRVGRKVSVRPVAQRRRSVVIGSGTVVPFPTGGR